MRDKLTGIVFIFGGAIMVALCLLMVFDVLGLQFDADREKASIQQVLQAQTEAWNKGDLDGFMAGYARSDELTFFSDGNTRQGWEATLKHFRAGYQGPDKPMGTLSFSDLRIELTGPRAAQVRGRYQLLGDKQDQGLFTLLFRKTPAGWQIVHDHTTRTRPPGS